MTFDFMGTRYAIWFKYTLHDGQRETVCAIDIADKNPATPFVCGSSLCAKSDQFTKAKGREIALERALKAAITNHGKGDAFWRAAMTCYTNRAKAQKVQVAA